MKEIVSYKIDFANGMWKYHVYRRTRWLGLFPYWRRIYRTDYIDHAERFVKECNDLPRYIDHVIEKKVS